MVGFNITIKTINQHCVQTALLFCQLYRINALSVSVIKQNKKLVCKFQTDKKHLFYSPFCCAEAESPSLLSPCGVDREAAEGSKQSKKRSHKGLSSISSMLSYSTTFSSTHYFSSWNYISTKTLQISEIGAQILFIDL